MLGPGLKTAPPSRIKGVLWVHSQRARWYTHAVIPSLPLSPGFMDRKQKPWEGVAVSYFTPENDSRGKFQFKGKKEEVHVLSSHSCAQKAREQT